MENNNTEIYHEVKATAYFGSVESGMLKLGDRGIEFSYDRPRRGKPMFFSWTSVRQVEADVSLHGKVGKQFSLILATQAKIRFSTKETGLVLKKMAGFVGKENIVRAPSLLDPFRKMIRR